MIDFKMKYLARRLTGRPLMVLPEKLTMILEGLGERIFTVGSIPALLDMSRMPAAPEKGLTTRKEAKGAKALPVPTHEGKVSTIAVIPVTGPLVHRHGEIGADSGYMRSYEKIRAELEEALTSKDVDGILLDIDSPGGEAAGNFELAEFIRQARREKPVFAVANTYAFSAAYNIGASAGRLYATPSGEVGSIGVIAVHVDQSEMDRKLGLKFTPVYAGARKNDFSPHAPLSDEARARLKESVDEYYDMFVESVSLGRGLSAEKIVSTEAGTFSARKAKALGLVDEIGTIENALMDLSMEITNQHKGDGTMLFFNKSSDDSGAEAALESAPEAAAAEAKESPEKESVKEGMEHDQSGENSPDVAAIAEQAALSERKRVLAILDLCRLGDLSLSGACELVAEGIGVDEARQKILDMKAQEDAGEVIHSHVGGISEAQDNPLKKAIDKRIEQAQGAGNLKDEKNPLLRAIARRVNP